MSVIQADGHVRYSSRRPCPLFKQTAMSVIQADGHVRYSSRRPCPLFKQTAMSVIPADGKRHAKASVGMRTSPRQGLGSQNEFKVILYTIIYIYTHIHIASVTATASAPLPPPPHPHQIINEQHSLLEASLYRWKEKAICRTRQWKMERQNVQS